MYRNGKNRGCASAKNARTRILAILVIVSLLFLSVPAAARGVSILATVGVSASPNPYDPNSHQMLMLSWTYEDMDHDTVIEIAGPEGFAERISVPGHKGYNSWALGYPDWRDGSYSIAVIPIGYERFAGSTTLTVKKIPIPHPAPPAPSVSSNPLYYPPERVTLAVTQFGGNTPRVIGAVRGRAGQYPRPPATGPGQEGRQGGRKGHWPGEAAEGDHGVGHRPGRGQVPREGQRP